MACSTRSRSGTSASRASSAASRRIQPRPVTRMTHIAMWSGPRNISTAMMRSFGIRPDTAVSDEPLYAHYLKVTGVAHPGRDDVLAAHESDWRRVAAELTGPVPGGRAIWYQKHMAHHLLPMIERGWLDRLTERLGRAPPVVLASDVLKDPRAQLEALCDRLDIPFLPAMLAWPHGKRETDGAWAPHWYAAVEASTGF